MVRTSEKGQFCQRTDGDPASLRALTRANRKQFTPRHRSLTAVDPNQRAPRLNLHAATSAKDSCRFIIKPTTFFLL
jgi:hypothetical protein